MQAFLLSVAKDTCSVYVSIVEEEWQEYQSIGKNQVTSLLPTTMSNIKHYKIMGIRLCINDMAFNRRHSVICSIDDLTVDGILDDVQHCVALIECEAGDLGLLLNHKRSEIFTNDPSSRSSILAQIPGSLVIEPQSATLLGFPLGDVESTSLFINDKTVLLQVMGVRLKYLCTHDSLLLRHNTFAIPKLMYLLWT